MGNEHSKSKETTKNGKIPEKHENRAVNGISASITSNGLEIGVNSEALLQQNGKPTLLNPATESNEPDFVIVESAGQHVEAQVISETPDTTVLKEEVKKNKEEKNHVFSKIFKKKAEPPASVQEKETSNEDQTDASLPATNPQLESSGEEAAATIVVVEHPEEFECPHHKAETSTQTDVKTEADISTQTSDDNDSTANTEDPVETAATEDHSLDESAVIIAEEVVEDAANEKPSDNQAAGIIITEVVNIENNVYKNMVFREERVEVTDGFEINLIKNNNPEKESVNGPEETEPEITTKPELNPNESIIVDEIAAEPLEVSSSLPKVVAACIEAVFAAVSDSSESVSEVITEDGGEGAGDTPADVALIETAEPEPNAVTPEAGEANGIPSLDGEPETKVMETIFEVVYEEPNPTPGDQDVPVEEPSVPLETEILVKMESAHEEVTVDDDDAAAIEDVPEKLSPVSDDITTVGAIMEASSKENQHFAIEEFPEDSLTSPDDVYHQSIPIIIITDVDAGEDVDAAEESEVSSAIVKEDTDVIPEAAIDALSQELDLSAASPPEPAADDASPLEEEVCAATVFMPLFAEQKASLTTPEEPAEETIIPSKDEIVAEEMKEEEAIQALANEFEAVPQSVDETSTEGEVAISEENVEEDAAPAEVLLEDAVKEAVAPSVEVSVILETSEDDFTEEVIQETDFSGDVLATAGDNTEDSQIAAVDETVAACVEAILEAIEVGEAECNPVTSEEVAPEAEEKAEDGSSAVTPPEPVADNASPLEEEVFAATVQQKASLTIPQEPVEETIIPSKDEILAEEMKEEAIQAVDEDTAVQETSTEGEVSIWEEPVEESDVAEAKTEDEPSTEATEEPVAPVEENVASAEVLLEDADKEAPCVVAVEESSPVVSKEAVEESVNSLEQQPKADALVVILETSDDDFTEEIIHETDYSGDNTEDSRIAAVDEAAAACVETIEVGEAECNPVTSEEEAPEAEETAEDRSTVPSTDLQENMKALIVKLQLACTSVVAESVYKLGDLAASSQGYNITINIHVAPKMEQQ